MQTTVSCFLIGPKVFQTKQPLKKKPNRLTMQRRHAAAEGQSRQEKQWLGHRLGVMLPQQAESESDGRSGELTEKTVAF